MYGKMSSKICEIFGKNRQNYAIKQAKLCKQVGKAFQKSRQKDFQKTNLGKLFEKSILSKNLYLYAKKSSKICEIFGKIVGKKSRQKDFQKKNLGKLFEKSILSKNLYIC